MLSTVANTLYNRLIDAFPADRSYSRRDFTREPMPKLVADYIEQSMNAEIPDLNPSLAEWFDLDHPEVKEARLVFGDVLGRHQRIPASSWSDVLLTACLRVVSFLVRPGTTLTDAVFGDERGPVRSEVVFDRIKPFSSYPYFRDVVAAYFEQRGVDAIDRERFAGLVRRIDRQMTEDYETNDWRKLLEPLFSVVRKVPELSGGLPVELLRSFFEEKQAAELVRKLDNLFPRRGVVKEANLHLLFEAEEVEVPETAGGRHLEIADDRKPVNESHASDRSSGPVPLWKQFERGEVSPAKPARPAAAVSEAAEPLWERFRKPSQATPESGDLDQVERAVLGERGARNRELFIKHLFSGSRDEYSRALQHLRQAQNWTEASQVIAQEVFLPHKVNIYSDPAVAFTDAAEARFR